jgi:hypothetical protein
MSDAKRIEPVFALGTFLLLLYADGAMTSTPMI